MLVQDKVMAELSVVTVPMMQYPKDTNIDGYSSPATGTSIPLNVPPLSQFQQIILHNFSELRSGLHTVSHGNDIFRNYSQSCIQPPTS